MTQKIGHALLASFSFISISILTLAIIITLFAYFEILQTSTISKLLYIAFVMIFFIGTLIVAKHVGEKGWLVGLAMTGILVLLNLLYHTIGIEASLNFRFLVRCFITLIICLTGGMIGVNLPKMRAK